MFGLGPGEIVQLLFIVALWLGAIAWVIRLAIAPMTRRLDRIIGLLEARR